MSLNSDFVESPTGSRPCKVTIKLKNGQVFSRRVEYAKGNPESPLAPEELRTKFVDCARRALDESSIQRALDCVGRLETLESIRPLAELLSGSKGK
jgi:2-methylcitrate dehydratase PrpD